MRAKIHLFHQAFLRQEAGNVQYIWYMLYSQVHTYIVSRLSPIYDPGEAEAIAQLLGERIAGSREAYRSFRGSSEPVDQRHSAILEALLLPVIDHKPVQYVLQEAWFYGLKFFVNEHVLIPRRETEELAHWVVEDIKNAGEELSGMRLLDLCTGSGCIALSIKHQLPGLQVMGCDISEQALEVANRNASDLSLDVPFFTYDLLSSGSLPAAPYSVMVSNPPYISYDEAAILPANVLKYEPALALFSGDDPLLFYRHLAQLGMRYLQEGGLCYVELHESRGKAVESIFASLGYRDMVLRKDMQGKERMLRVKRP
jgi:release factor glutamine methyltransferase